jgi:hypothetical protein
MAVPTWVVGQVLAAADVNSWFVPTAAYKTANLNRTSGLYTIDPDLQFTLAASAYYEVRAGICYTGTTGTGFSWAWTLPSGAGGGYGAAFNLSGTGASNIGYQWSASPGTAGTPGSTQSILLHGFISSGSGGTFGLQWATGTPGTAATCGQGSVLVAQRIG